MTTLSLAELERAAGRDLGTGSWRIVDQEQVNRFADATDDRQWIHVDPARAAGGPFGGTVAHGYLTLSLIPSLLGELLTISGSSMLVNYGTDRIRFPAPVRVGSRVRLNAVLVSAESRASGVLCRIATTIEMEGSSKPALAGEVLLLAT